MTYGEAIGTVGEPTNYTCDSQHVADECAFVDRGSSARTRNHALPSFETKHANTRLISRRSRQIASP